MVVVLPEPCSPSIKITRGRAVVSCSPPLASPNSASSSSRTILMTCCDGFRPFWTSTSIARSRTRSTNALTTLKLTSASSSARRISPSTLSTVASVRRVSPLSDWKTSWRRLLSASNIRSATTEPKLRRANPYPTELPGIGQTDLRRCPSFSFFTFRYLRVRGGGVDFERDRLGNRQPVSLQADEFTGVIGQQPHRADTEVRGGSGRRCRSRADRP